MDVKATNAALDYTEALTRATGLGDAGNTGARPAGPSFAELLGGMAGDAVSAVKQGERVSIQSLSNEAGLFDIVTAVSNAEITLETVVALRDRVVQAYQEILRMPIKSGPCLPPTFSMSGATPCWY